MNSYQLLRRFVSIRVEASMTGQLRDHVPHSKKYKVVQNFPLHEDRHKEDCNSFGKFIP